MRISLVHFGYPKNKSWFRLFFFFWPPTRGRCQPVRHRRSGPCIEFGEFACISPGRLLPMCDPVTKYNGTQPGASRSHPETGRGQLPIRPLTMEMENPRPWISVPATTRQWTSPRTRYGWPAPNLAGKHQMALFLSPKARRPRGDERAAIPPAFLGMGPSGHRCHSPCCALLVNIIVALSLLCSHGCVPLVVFSLLCVWFSFFLFQASHTVSMMVNAARPTQRNTRRAPIKDTLK